MRAPTTWRKIATIRCICNAGLHHCNGQMYLQPSVAPPHPVGARISRPFIPDVIITLRADARRVIGATAKPLYPIDGKAGGLDRRNPQTSLLEGGGPPAGGGRSSRRRWKEFPTEVVTEGVPAGGGRRYPQIPFKSPNVFMAYVAMPQAAASPRPALSNPPATAA